MKISVLIPTRGRTNVLCRGVDSVINNFYNLSNIELIFRFDNDDLDTLNHCMDYYQVEKKSETSVTDEFKWGKSEFKVIDTISKKYNISIKFIIGKRHGYVLLNRYYDEMAYISNGEYLLIWADDFELLDNSKYAGWDLLVSEGKGQLYLFVFDWNDGYPRVVPRKFYELNGRLCPNLLDDRYWMELSKVVDIFVRLDWKADHHCQWDPGGDPLVDGRDVTAYEGRGEFINNRRSGVENEWQFYDIEDFNRIENYLEEHPNYKKTSQTHDPKGLYGQELNRHPDCWKN